MKKEIISQEGILSDKALCGVRHMARKCGSRVLHMNTVLTSPSHQVPDTDAFTHEECMLDIPATVTLAVLTGRMPCRKARRFQEYLDGLAAKCFWDCDVQLMLNWRS